jgi:predicted ATPase/class 3 adenylate cyclase
VGQAKPPVPTSVRSALVAELHAFLMTDLVASTRAMRADIEALRRSLEDHDEAIARSVAKFGGRVFKHTGDGACAVFADPVDAVRAAVAAQSELTAIDVAVRMALDVGAADRRGDDFFGLSLSHCARLLAVTSGHQILVTLAVEELLRDALPDDVELAPVGPVSLRDFDRPEDLFQVVAPGLHREFPPLGDRVVAAFPTARSNLVGRDDELATIVDLVVPGRVVSLVGPGGAGKTRLALEVLARRHQPLGGGVFVDLAAVEDPRVVAQSIADAVGMQYATSEVTSELVTFLARRSLLLVVDNCEHVLSAAAEVVDAIVDRCRGVAVLTTTREPLHVVGERIVRLGSLATPDAAQLFADRVANAGGGPIDDRQRPVVEDICTRLDGIPLAVELAAAQAAHLPLPTLQSLLAESLEVLQGRSRASARHQTLEQTLAWSYALLSAEEQRMLRHLAAFSSAFSLHGAACVAGRDLVSAARTVGSLVDKSLVVLDPASSYRLLETVRAFGRARLAEADEVDAAFDRLRRGMLEAAPGPWACWLCLPPPEDVSFGIDNVRGVLEWCVACGRPDDARMLVASSLSLWFMIGRAVEAGRWLDQASGPDGPDEIRLAAIVARSWMAISEIDIPKILGIRTLRATVPDDHPAARSLQFLIAWTAIDRGVTTFDRMMGPARVGIDEDGHWLRMCQLLRGITLMVERRHGEAIDELIRVAAAGGADAHYVTPNLAAAEHLAGRHHDVTALRRDLEEVTFPVTSFSDLTLDIVAIADHIGRHEVPLARRHLRSLLDDVERNYTHVPLVAGFGVELAGVIAAVGGQPEVAVTLLAGSRYHRLHLRFEGARALGDHYLDVAAAGLAAEAVATAWALGEQMTVGELVALSHRVADGEPTS